MNQFSGSRSGVSIPITDTDQLIHTLWVNNTTGTDQNLNVVLGASDSGDYRFAGVVIQTTVPEPSSVLAITAMGLFGLIRRRNR